MHVLAGPSYQSCMWIGSVIRSPLERVMQSDHLFVPKPTWNMDMECVFDGVGLRVCLVQLEIHEDFILVVSYGKVVMSWWLWKS